jgi:hypothetical protein
VTNWDAVQFGKISYWAGSIIAGLLVAAVVVSYILNADRGVPILRVAPLVLAGVIWLAGWACCYLLTER